MQTEISNTTALHACVLAFELLDHSNYLLYGIADGARDRCNVMHLDDVPGNEDVQGKCTVAKEICTTDVHKAALHQTTPIEVALEAIPRDCGLACNV